MTAVLHYNLFGSIYPVMLSVSSYMNPPFLYLHLIGAGEDDTGEPFLDITANLDTSMDPFCAAVKNYSENHGIEEFIIQNHLGTPTGKFVTSGFVQFPVFEFDPDRLRELHPQGVKRYEAMLKKTH